MIEIEPMTTASMPDMYVLDALANDVEDIESILRMLNSETDLGWRAEWGREFNRLDVVSALSRLIRQDFVRVFIHDEEGKALREIANALLPPANYDDAYFGMTERGRVMHSNWDPPTQSE